jgi:large subunit ribosomal protein L22
MNARAQAKHIRESPYKVRRVLDLVRGLPVGDARVVLEFTDRKAAGTIIKVLDSAVANAEHNFALDADELFVAEAFADEGPTLKRWRPRARGRATKIRKRTSHITIVVAEIEEVA